MTKIKSLLLEIEKFYIEKNIPILAKLQDGVADILIEKYLSSVGIKSKDLVSLYSWRNGVRDFGNYLINELELFPEGIMLSLENAISYYNIYTKKEKIWDIGLFPVFTSGGGDFYLVSAEKELSSPIYLYSPSIFHSEIPEIVYNSLESLLECQLNCLLQGAYTYNYSEQSFEINYSLREEICRMNNPNIAYWR